jgi:hypothetical protein
MMRLKLPNGVTTSAIDAYGENGCADVIPRL